MRPVVLQVFDFSLDGIIGEEDTEFYEFCRAVPEDPAYSAWLISSLERAGAHIMGRVTYEEMAEYWPTVTDATSSSPAEVAIAKVLNARPKAVFSRTLQNADWANSTILRGDTAEELDALRQTGTGEILAHGGASFVQSLAGLDVVDEYRLTVYPYLAGSGKKLFADIGRPRELELVSSSTFADGVVTLVYRRRRCAQELAGGGSPGGVADSRSLAAAAGPAPT
jgi:dihydrofolate reductase